MERESVRPPSSVYSNKDILIKTRVLALVQLFTVTALNDSEMVISAAGVDLVSFGNALPRIIRPLGCAIVLGGLGVLLIGIKKRVHLITITIRKVPKLFFLMH